MLLTQKIPGIGTSIFTKMSAMANDYNAMNLSQGFPGFDIDPKLADLVTKYMREGKNQYAPMAGLPELRNSIAQSIQDRFKLRVNPDLEITVTAGATEAIFCAIQALVHAGDEVIVIDPCYDCYVPSITLAGGKAVRVPAADATGKLPHEAIQDALSTKTKLLIINNPHNPLGGVLAEEDMMFLHNLIMHHPLMIMFDEVYEAINFTEEGHHSVLQYPELYDRSLAVYSFGKTFHTTGWKLGYVVAKPSISQLIRTIHQFVVFAVNTPMQCAVAEYLQDQSNIDGVGPMYQHKRDLFLKQLEGSNWRATPAQGSYFQILDYSMLSNQHDVEFTEQLVTQFGLSTIPVSVFYEHPDPNQKLIRVCFAKEDAEIEKAGELLRYISDQCALG